MKKRLIILWIAISCVTLISTWGIIGLKLQHDKNHKETRYELCSDIESEHREDVLDAYAGMYAVLMTFLDFFLAILSTAIFLNGYEDIRTSRVHRFLSFFLLPFVFLTVIFFMNIDDLGGLVVVLPASGPHFVCLTIAYIWFSRWLRRNETSL
jgi:hypothetical protein